MGPFSTAEGPRTRRKVCVYHEAGGPRVSGFPLRPSSAHHSHPLLSSFPAKSWSAATRPLSSGGRHGRSRWQEEREGWLRRGGQHAQSGKGSERLQCARVGAHAAAACPGEAGGVWAGLHPVPPGGRGPLRGLSSLLTPGGGGWTRTRASPNPRTQSAPAGHSWMSRVLY